jgi:dolichyl-phosphate beta-glucosyltransferase
MEKLFISFVIPAYNEEKRINLTLKKLNIFFKEFLYNYEIIFVNDGSTDKTSNIIAAFISEHNLTNYRLENISENSGKGYAVKKGMEISSNNAELFFFMDADLSTPLEEIKKFIEFYLNNNFNILIGSRSLKKSNVIKKQNFLRQTLGKIFNKIVKLIFPTKFIDTQCGFKMFDKKSKDIIFNKTLIKGFAFDVEIIFLAKLFKLNITDLPVVWKNNELSKVHIIKDSLKMIFELIKIRINLLQKKYEN